MFQVRFDRTPCPKLHKAWCNRQHEHAGSTCWFQRFAVRWGQCIILALAAQFQGSLHSADISEAFLRGFFFEELSEEDPSQPPRVVEIALPAGTEERLQSFPGYESYNAGAECLSLLKPGVGLKDAPRLWNAALTRVLRLCGFQSTCTDHQPVVLETQQRWKTCHGTIRTCRRHKA